MSVWHTFYGSFLTRIRWWHSFLRLAQLKVVRSRSCQIRLNQTQNFNSEACLSCAVLPRNSKNDIYFDVRLLEMPKNRISKTSKFRHGIARKPVHSGQILFTARCAGDLEWSYNHWHSLSSFSVINFGNISGRFKSVCIGMRELQECSGCRRCFAGR